MGRTDRSFVCWRSTSNEYGNASWAILDQDMLMVRTEHGQKLAVIGGSPPETLVRIMMKELRDDATN